MLSTVKPQLLIKGANSQVRLDTFSKSKILWDTLLMSVPHGNKENKFMQVAKPLLGTIVMSVLLWQKILGLMASPEKLVPYSCLRMQSHL